MNKPIINGIDVSECGFCCWKHNGNELIENYCALFNNKCICNPNCYFKQLKCLEQERDELQDKYSKMIHKYNDLYEKYRAKEILEPDLKNEIKKFDALSIKYGQALEEIRELIIPCKTFMEPISIYKNLIEMDNKINEVLNDK